MARSIEEIYTGLIAEVRTALGIPDTTALSATSIEAMLAYAFAWASNLLEKIMDAFLIDLEATLAELKPHTITWYAGIVQAFQYGYEIDSATGTYNNSALTEEEVQASQIIAQVSLLEKGGELQIKVAKLGADLEPLTSAELTSLTAYMEKQKDAGVVLDLISEDADDLKMTLTAYVDPLLFNADGTLIQGGEPVREAVESYLKQLGFNQEFTPAFLLDELSAITGVQLVSSQGIEIRTASVPYEIVGDFAIPASGYMRLASDADLVINYILKTA